MRASFCNDCDALVDSVKRRLSPLSFQQRIMVSSIIHFALHDQDKESLLIESTTRYGRTTALLHALCVLASMHRKCKLLCDNQRYASLARSRYMDDYEDVPNNICFDSNIRKGPDWFVISDSDAGYSYPINRCVVCVPRYTSSHGHLGTIKDVDNCNETIRKQFDSILTLPSEHFIQFYQLLRLRIMIIIRVFGKDVGMIIGRLIWAMRRNAL